MEYRFGEARNYQDFAPGRVFHGRPGATNFPVRLTHEIFGRCLGHSVKKTGLTLYDPCCGSGYLLAVATMFYHDAVDKVVGSDSDARALETASKNLGLLSSTGLDHRRHELSELVLRFGRPSHAEALESVGMLERLLVPGKEIRVEVFQQDALAADGIHPDIILCDLPYGALTQWSGAASADEFLIALARVATPQTVVAVVYERQVRLNPGLFRFLERHQVGKRKFAILKKNT